MDSFEFLEILVAWTPLCLRLMCCFMFLSAANDLLHSGHFTFAWSCRCFWCWWWFKKRSWSFYKAHPLAWYGWCYVHSTFVISQIRLGSCFILAVCRVWTRKNFMRILCYVQFVTSEVDFCFGNVFHSPDTKFVFQCSLCEQSFLLCKCLFLCFHWNPISSQRLIFYHSVWDFFAASEI